MLFTYDNMLSFKDEIKIKSKEEAKEKLGKTQPKILKRKKMLSELAKPKVKSGFGEPTQ